MFERWRKKLKDAAVTTEEKPADPRMVAEQLLASVLPGEIYLSLAAYSYADVAGKINKSYRLFRQSKTHVTYQNGDVYQACIEFNGHPMPTADRLAAEYLLIVNDEAKYLETANLTKLYTGGELQNGGGGGGFYPGAVIPVQHPGSIIYYRGLYNDRAIQTYDLHLAPTSGLTAGQTVFIQDATASSVIAEERDEEIAALGRSLADYVENE